MITDINKVELMPPIHGTIDMTTQISSLFLNAKSIRAAIAFWSLSIDTLNQITGNNAFPVLNAPGSFLCVDIQYPTNIDHLAELVRKNVSIHLNIRRLPRKIERVLLKRISSSPGLLHTKILLAERENSEVEFWIGSHNWTECALRGPNTEASLAIHMNKNTQMYYEIETLLQDIKDNYCRPFDLNEIEYYKDLQELLHERQRQPKGVIELEGRNVSNLTGEVINIFGTEIEDLNLVPPPNQEVKLSLYDSEAFDKHNIEQRYLYKCIVLQSGVLETFSPGARGITITDQRRYAFTQRRRFPVLEQVQAIDNIIFSEAYYFVTIEVEKLESRDYILSEPGEAKIPLWVPSGLDPIFERMDSSFLQEKRFFSPLILVSRDDQRKESHYEDSWAWQEEYGVQTAVEIPLLEKRETRGYSLISKKVITKND